MEQVNFRPSVTSVVAAVGIALAILLGTMATSQKMLESSFYRRGELIGAIVSQDGVELLGLLQDQDNRDMLLRFAGAVTSAYINFELLPVNEANTFVAVYDSVRGLVTVESFEYQRKTLVITGTAPNEQNYRAFVQNLQQQDYFEKVEGHYYIDTDDAIQFEVQCSSADIGLAIVLNP